MGVGALALTLFLCIIMSKLIGNERVLEAWTKVGEDPADLMNWWLGSNPFYDDSECLMHTGYPKMVAWYNVDFVFAGFGTWASELRVTWIDECSDDIKEVTISSAWNFLALEEMYVR